MKRSSVYCLYYYIKSKFNYHSTVANFSCAKTRLETVAGKVSWNNYNARNNVFGHKINGYVPTGHPQAVSYMTLVFVCVYVCACVCGIYAFLFSIYTILHRFFASKKKYLPTAQSGVNVIFRVQKRNFTNPDI